MFISHLDLMRVFARAFRRGHIPVTYSKGFNPHAEMVFGLPLSVGVTSECEYLDLTIEDEAESKWFEPGTVIAELNAQLPDGVRVLEVKPKQGKASVMSQITHASYTVKLTVANRPLNPAGLPPESLSSRGEGQAEEASELLKRKVEDFLNSGACYVSKTRKGKTKEIDIRPLVKEIIVPETVTSGELSLKMLLSAGSNENLKPELLLSYLGLDSGDPFIKGAVHRTGLFIDYR